MRRLRMILGFGWPYLRRYWVRFACGVLIAVLFGLSNATFLWAINTVLKRMTPEDPPAKTQAAPSSGTIAQWRTYAAETNQRFADAWLPRVGHHPNWQQILGGLLLFPVLAFVRGFSGYLSSYCLAWVSERVVNDLRVDVFRKLSSLSLDFYNRSTTGDLLTRVNVDTASLQRCLNLGLADLIKEPVTIVGIVAGLCFIDWQLMLVTMVCFPLLLLPIIIYGRKVRKAATAGLKTSINQASLLVEMLSGIRIIKAFNLDDEQVERYRKLSRELVHFGMKGVRAKEIINPIIEVMATFGFGCLLVYVVYRQISVENMASLLFGVAFIYTPVRKLASVHVLLQQTDAGVRRLVQIMQEQPAVREPAQPIRLPAFKTGIAFENVDFSYAQQPVLTRVNLTVPRGFKLGVAGVSGSGKSTLVNLVFRFYDPTGGRVLIDGQNLRDVSLRDLRGLLALVSQDVVVFDQSVAENIACGRRDATREEIEAAARDAFAHDFIRQLPQGYETRVGERGVTLSGGQRQRIAIARAFVRNAPILVLDEATGSLDSQAEAEVQSAIERLEENRTVICVAHRLSTLSKMDAVVVLSEGQIVQQGRFDELISQPGPFSDMAARQGIQRQAL
jgi:subfamily B ATP-binding cassette protein MsbA